MTHISYFQTIYSFKAEYHSLDWYLSHVQSGSWRPLVERLREKPDSDRSSLLPVVALSGRLESTQNGISLTRHSGFIALELEGFLDLQRGKQMLSQDRYTYAVFENAKGDALCVLTRIDGQRHIQAFEGLRRYYEAVYGLIASPSSRNATRLFWVSSDPDLIVNAEAALFKG